MSKETTWHWEKATSRDGNDTVSLRDGNGKEILACEEDATPDDECAALIAAAPDFQKALSDVMKWAYSHLNPDELSVAVIFGNAEIALKKWAALAARSADGGEGETGVKKEREK